MLKALLLCRCQESNALWEAIVKTIEFSKRVSMVFVQKKAEEGAIELLSLLML